MSNRKHRRTQKKQLESKTLTKIAVAMLTGDKIFTDTSYCHLDMFAYSMMQGYHMTWLNPKVSRIETGRNMAVQQAKEKKADYLLFMDSDMTCHRDSLIKLIKRNVDIVGCNCPKRKVPFLPVYTEDINGQWLDYKKGLMYEMDYVGMAFTLIKMSVFDKLETPYFYASFSKDNHNVPLGEDICFCRAAREVGFKIWCDMDVSMGIGHIITQALYLPKDFTKEMYKSRLIE